MSPRYRQILEWRKEGKTFREIGELMGVTRGRVSQMYRLATLKLKKEIN